MVPHGLVLSEGILIPVPSQDSDPWFRFGEIPSIDGPLEIPGLRAIEFLDKEKTILAQLPNDGRFVLSKESEDQVQKLGLSGRCNF